jgi:hypothetical protein
MTSLSANRAKRIPAPLRYVCPVCGRKSQYAGPCGTTCRERATPEQKKPVLGTGEVRWNGMP